MKENKGKRDLFFGPLSFLILIQSKTFLTPKREYYL